VLAVVLLMTVVVLLRGDVAYQGLVAMPPSLAPTFMQMDIAAAFDVAMLSVIFAFLFVDIFDNSGTLLAVTQKAGLADQDGNVERLGEALTADSLAAVAGAALGTSTTTSYVESAAGDCGGIADTSDVFDCPRHCAGVYHLHLNQSVMWQTPRDQLECGAVNGVICAENCVFKLIGCPFAGCAG